MATKFQWEIHEQIFHCAELRLSELLLLPFCSRLDAQAADLVRYPVWHHVAEAGDRDLTDNGTRAWWLVEAQAIEDSDGDR